MQNLENLAALIAALPENFRANAQDLVDRMGATVEGIGDEPIAWKPPFLKIMQATTDRASAPRGTSIGDLLMGEEKVDSPLMIIPLRLWQGRQYWDPNPENKKMLCQSPDAKVGYIGRECKGCPHAEWVEGQGSDCNKIYTLMAITSDLKHIFTVNFAKTSYKVGQELEGMLRKAGVAIYARQYQLSTKTIKNYETFEVAPTDAANRKTPEGLISFVKELFGQIDSGRKEAVQAFYKVLEDRRAQGLLQAPQAAPALTDSGGADSTLGAEPEVAAPAPAGKTSKAKSYEV